MDLRFTGFGAKTRHVIFSSVRRSGGPRGLIRVLRLCGMGSPAPAEVPILRPFPPLPPHAGRPMPRLGRSYPSPAAGRSGLPAPTGQYPAPAGSEWSTDAGPAVGTGSDRHAGPCTSPALLALAADPSREPRRSGTWWDTPNLERAGARRRPLALTLMAPGQRVTWLPAIRHTVPIWPCPADPSWWLTSGPASRRASGGRAHCARPVATTDPGRQKIPGPASNRALRRVRAIEHTVPAW
jgi:hypothetical protein